MRLMGGTMSNPIPLPSLKAKCVPAGPAQCHRTALACPIMPACPPPRAPSVWKHLTGSAIETKEPLLTLHVRPLGLYAFFCTTFTFLSQPRSCPFVCTLSSPVCSPHSLISPTFHPLL